MMNKSEALIVSHAYIILITIAAAVAFSMLAFSVYLLDVKINYPPTKPVYVIIIVSTYLHVKKNVIYALGLCHKSIIIQY